MTDRKKRLHCAEAKIEAKGKADMPLCVTVSKCGERQVIAVSP